MGLSPGVQRPGVRRKRLLGSALLIMGWVTSALAADDPSSARLNLHSGWQLQSACKLAGADTPAGVALLRNPRAADGATLSSSSYHPDGWIAASVPTTILAAQVSAGIIRHPFLGDNIRNLAGVDYPQGGLYSNMGMRETSPYNCGWWFRTQFRAPTSFTGRSVALHLNGVNYRADVWLNGKLVASKENVAGTWRVFEFNVSDGILAGRENTLAIEVFPPTPQDLAMTWVDWNPDPPDKNTGLFRDVYLTAGGPVALRFPFVATKLDDNFQSARLTPTVDARNTSSRPQSAVISWEIEGKTIRQEISLGAGTEQTVTLDPDQHPELTIRNPRLWWPAQLGTPALYHARVTVTVDSTVSEAQDVTFGIRQVTSELANGHLLFKINGKPIVIRGAAWAGDMLLRYSPREVETEFRYVRDLGLNTIRLEGKFQPNHFYELADKNGIFILAGWTCCDEWERWNEWGPEQYKIAEASQRDQLRLLRNHPSSLVWLNGSDNPPPAAVERMYLNVGHEVQWPNPFVSSASATSSTVSGPSGVKMTGPYDYVPPAYWYDDKKEFGGAWGFNTETSPGPAIPIPESLRKFLPADKLWPQNETWGVHEGGERFQTITAYNTSLERRYGAPKDLGDFMRKAYAMDYEAERAMFEAYTRNKYNSTGVIQWMLNNAWPSLIWHLYDYYLMPAGGYYGTKKACEPVHVMYSYDDRAVVMTSENGRALSGVRVSAQLYNLDATQKWSQEETINVSPEAAEVAFKVPALPELSTTYFLKLTAKDGEGKPLSENSYWLSTKADELDWTATHDTVYTPQSAYADLTGLQDLDRVAVGASISQTKAAEDGFETRTVSLVNPSKAIAFMIHLRLANSEGESVTPTLWEDNYLTLLPGESRQIVARYPTREARGGTLHVAIDGWNVESLNKPLP